jgi:DNA (cytosine-5)-methyltransferase 1
MRRKGSRKRRKIIAIDYFCGAGGLTHGLKKAGIQVIAGLDNEEKARVTYEINNSPAIFYSQDLNDLKSSVGITKEILKSSRYDYSVFAACAPCQPFSSQNRKYTNDKRRSLMLSFVKLIEELPNAKRPDFIFAENVGPMKKRG